jgi:hypothetical protein
MKRWTIHILICVTACFGWPLVEAVQAAAADDSLAGLVHGSQRGAVQLLDDPAPRLGHQGGTGSGIERTKAS